MQFRFEDVDHDLAFLANVLDSIEDAIVVIDHDYTVRWSNRAFRAAVGGVEDPVVGEHCHVVSHHLNTPCRNHVHAPPVSPACDCPVAMVFETGASQEAMHTHFDDDNNPVYVEIKAYPVRAATGEVAYAIEVIKDVTQRVHLEEELRHAQKMEAVGLLVGGVAHDFNNVLTAITGYGELLQMDAEEGSTSRMATDEILAAAERATRLTRSLLTFSYKERTDLGIVKINEIVCSIERLLRRLLGEDVELDLRLVEEEVLLYADRYQIEQVLMNFATNARDAMAGGGGALTVATEVVHLEEEDANARGLTAAGSYCLLSVSDTGVGIQAKTRPHIFDPFFTTKRVGRGTGLGLSMVYRIVEQHGGHVTVESRPDEGTTFRVYLPLCEAGATATNSPSSERCTLPRGRETVLVAEDDTAVRNLMIHLLQEYGYGVVVARDGDATVKQCREYGGKIDLYVLDVVMPHKGGEVTFKEVKSIHPEARVLFVSGYSRESLHHRGFTGEGVDLLTKPISRAVFLRKVRAILDDPVTDAR